MNKKLAFAAAFAATIGISSAFAGGPETFLPPKLMPDFFTGFYFGGDGSFQHVSFNIDGSVSFNPNVNVLTNTFTTVTSIDGGGQTLSGYGGIQGGWGRVLWRRYYLGVQGFGDFGSTTQTSSGTFVDVDSGTTSNLNYKAKFGDSYGVVAKLGVLVTPATMFYTKLGIAWADITATQDISATTHSDVTGLNTITPIASSSHQGTRSAFLWGFGGEQFVWGKMVSLFGEYTFADYGTVNAPTVPVLDVTTDDVTTVSQTNFNEKVRADQSSFKGGVNVYFGSNLI